LAGKLAAGHRMEFLVQRGEDAIERAATPVSGGIQQLGDIDGRLAHVPPFGADYSSDGCREIPCTGPLAAFLKGGLPLLTHFTRARNRWHALCVSALASRAPDGGALADAGFLHGFAAVRAGLAPATVGDELQLEV